MKQLVTALLVLASGSLSAQTQPKIASGGVLNSGSYSPPGLPNAAIAQGSLFVVKGTNLGPAVLQQVAAYPLTASLGGTSVAVTVNGTTTRPLLFYTSAGQIAAILPSATPVGTGTITITYNGQTSATSAIQVVSSSFGIYTVNASGNGAGLITNQSFQLASSNAAANPGEAFIIFGTGVGPATGDETGPGSGLKLGTIPVEVLVGGKSASVYGYARAPQFSGLDQVAFAVPAGVTGCAVPVAVKIGTVISNYVSLAIAASGRTCSDATGTGPVPGYRQRLRFFGQCRPLSVHHVLGDSRTGCQQLDYRRRLWRFHPLQLCGLHQLRKPLPNRDLRGVYRVQLYGVYYADDHYAGRSSAGCGTAAHCCRSKRDENACQEQWNLRRYSGWRL